MKIGEKLYFIIILILLSLIILTIFSFGQLTIQQKELPDKKVLLTSISEQSYRLDKTGREDLSLKIKDISKRKRFLSLLFELKEHMNLEDTVTGKILIQELSLLRSTMNKIAFIVEGEMKVAVKKDRRYFVNYHAMILRMMNTFDMLETVSDNY